VGEGDFKDFIVDFYGIVDVELVYLGSFVVQKDDHICFETG